MMILDSGLLFWATQYIDGHKHQQHALNLRSSLFALGPTKY